MIRIGYFFDKTKPLQDGPPETALQGCIVGSSLATTPSPQPSSATRLPVTFRGTASAWQMDHMGHLNMQHYAGMFDQANWVLAALVGLDARYFRENHRGMAALEQHIRFIHELYAGDVVEIRSAVLDVGDKTIRFFHDMRKAGSGDPCAQTTILGVHVDTDLRKSLPFPSAVRERARALAVSEEVVSGANQ